MDETDAHIRATNLDIEFDSNNNSKSTETQKIQLYNVATLPQKIQLWLIVVLSVASLVTNLTSIAATFGLSSFNKTDPCPKWPQRP